MKILGFVNSFGRGVHRAQKSLRDNGSKEAQFEFNLTFTLAKVSARQ